MMKKYLFILLALLLFGGCASVSKGISQVNPTLQYIGTHEDGSITVRVAATGRNYADALSNAQRFALKRTIFNGISVPGNTLLSRPLITEVNAEEKYESFFNSFFSNGGDYVGFVNSQDKRFGSDQMYKNKVSVRVMTTIRIFRSDLKEYLQNNLMP